MHNAMFPLRLRRGLRLALGAIALAPALCAAQDTAASAASAAVSPAPATVPASASIVPPMPVLPTATQDPNAIRVLLSPELETTLVAQIAGRIDNLQAGLGAAVRKGQPIVSFDCAETQARLRMAQAEHGAARETLNAKQRLRTLNAAGDVEVSLARADVDKSAAAIGVARAQLAHCAVAAPFDGRIVKVHVKQHQGVNAGAPLLELVSDGPLKLRLNVPSRLLRQLQIGSPLEVDILETGKTYPAKITAINARVDAVAQTIELEASLDDRNPDLLPGMSGIARLPAAAS